MMQAVEIKKHLSNDAVFNLINRRFITLDDAEVKRNNVYLLQVIKTITERMKTKDQLFAKAYEKVSFCGSFYKGTKVGKPNEFDINIILKLNYGDIEFIQPRAGFIQIKINDIGRERSIDKFCYKTNARFITSNLLDPEKFRRWIESIVIKVYNELTICKHTDTRVLEVKAETWFKAKIKIRKSGPAFTVILNIPEESNEISIDFVPVLAFDINRVRPFIPNFSWLEKVPRQPWFSVPIVSDNETIIPAFSWRIAFSPQEKDILTMYGRLKPVIRQMKKLRDTQNWTGLKSYFIETVFLNRLPELSSLDLNNTPFTFLFFKMLKALQEACERRRINYFWNPNFNLIEKNGFDEMTNVANRINNIIKDIEKSIVSQSFILAKYILTKNELQLLSDESYFDENGYNEVNLDHLYALTEVIQTKATDEQGQWCTIL